MLVFQRDGLVVVRRSLLNTALVLHLAAHVVYGELFALSVRIVSDVALANLIDAVASWYHLQILLLGLLEPTRMVERVDEFAGVLETRHSTDMTSPHLT